MKRRRRSRRRGKGIRGRTEDRTRRNRRRGRRNSGKRWEKVGREETI